MLGNYFEEYEEFSDTKIKTIDPNHDPSTVMLNAYDYKGWYKEEE